MLLAATGFQGYLDVSGPEVLGSTLEGWLGAAAQYRRAVRSGDFIRVPDEYLRFPNILNAVNAGYLVVLSYDSAPESIVINAELAGSGVPVSGTKYIFLDIHGGQDTAEIKSIGGAPSLIFEDGCDHRSKWSITVPDDYVAGTPIHAEVFWSPSVAGPATVRWLMEYKTIAAGASVLVPPASVVYLQGMTAADVLYTTGTFLVIPAGAISAGGLVTASISRTAKHADDTLSGTVRVHLVRFNYTGKKFS